MTPINELPGSQEALPKKKKCKFCDGEATTTQIKEGGYVSCCPDGDSTEHSFNDCHDQYSKVEVGNDKNKLQDAIIEALIQERKVVRAMVFNSQEENDFIIASFIAKHLCQNEREILVVKRKD